MRKWKTPADYKDKDFVSSCEYEIRKEIGCTQRFYDMGFLKDLHWDRYAEYRTLCKSCTHYTHNVGIYFGNGNHTDNIKDLDSIWCNCRISDENDFDQFLSIVPQNVKAIYFDDIRIENLFGLEAFASLECVLIAYCPKLVHFWNFSLTPHLKVLEYTANTHLTDISELSTARSLEYFGINSLVSRTNLTYIDSLYPLTKLEHLKEVSLESTMCSDNNIDDLISIPDLQKLWISPHTFSTEDFAKFEALKFKIYEEYGIYRNGDDYIRPLGKGGRCFRSERSKETFKKEYQDMMSKYKK